jgi:hypothetical protein
MEGGIQPEPKFESSQDEINFLRQQVTYHSLRARKLDEDIRWYRYVIELLSGNRK